MKRTALLLPVLMLSMTLIAGADDYYWIDPAGGELGDATK